MWTTIEGTMVAKRYELQGRIALGGMAVLFRGWDHVLHRPVAVKVLRPFTDLDPVAIARFRREARVIAQLRHPRIVEFFDFIEDGSCSYLIMERIEGMNLKEHLMRHGVFSPMEAFQIAIQVCYALEAIHAQGFVHRDIKPQNILLDATGQAKVADFGVVHVAQERGFTMSGIVLGTVEYLSPEQAQGEAPTPMADIYSLGVVLYQMLCGTVPFSGTTPVAIALQHVSTPAPSLRRLRPDTPEIVEQIVMRALAKDPRQRYPSAEALRARLTYALNVLATEGASEPHKTMRRHEARRQGSIWSEACSTGETTTRQSALSLFLGRILSAFTSYITALGDLIQHTGSA